MNKSAALMRVDMADGREDERTTLVPQGWLIDRGRVKVDRRSDYRRGEHTQHGVCESGTEVGRYLRATLHPYRVEDVATPYGMLVWRQPSGVWWDMRKRYEMRPAARGDVATRLASAVRIYVTPRERDDTNDEHPAWSPF